MALPFGLDNLPPWALLATGGVAGYLKSGWQSVYGHTIGEVKRRLTLSIFVERSVNDEGYRWLLEWASQFISAKTNNNYLLLRQYTNLELVEHVNRPKNSVKYLLSPDYGVYRRRWNRLWVVIENTKTASEKGYPDYSIRVTVWGSRNPDVLKRIMKEAEDLHDAKYPQQSYLYTPASHGWYSKPLLNRRLSSVYLPDAVLRDILADAGSFMNNHESYASMGVPWRRGYGFFGSPGTGKSTMAQVLASHLGLPVYYLNVGDPELTSSSLSGQLNSMETPSILLLEDVDCANVAQIRTEGDQPRKGISASDLLNALDGLLASEGRLLIMTSNHPDRLDPALIRAGRVDRIFNFKPAEDEALQRFYTKANSVFHNLPSWEEFRVKLPENATLADAQALVFGASTRFRAGAPQGPPHV